MIQVILSSVVFLQSVFIARAVTELTVLSGRNLTLNCSWNPGGDSPRADSPPSWHYSVASERLETFTTSNNSSSLLTIRYIDVEDSGNYSCITTDGVTLEEYHVSVGLLPTSPENIECYSYNFKDVYCTWDPVPNTYLPVQRTCQFWNLSGNFKWYNCPAFNGTFAHFINPPTRFKVRLNIMNALGKSTANGPEFALLKDTKSLPPNNISIHPVSSSQIDVYWSIPDVADVMRSSLEYQISIRNRFNNNSFLKDIPKSELESSLNELFPNTAHCIRIRSGNRRSWGAWSEPVCDTTHAAVPNVVLKWDDIPQETKSNNGRKRKVTVFWRVEKDSHKPDQGLNGFNLSVVSINSADERMMNQPPITLENHRLNYTIPNLSTTTRYTFLLSAFNSAGSSDAIRLDLNSSPQNNTYIKAVKTIPSILCPLALLALLSFGYQRLKNNSVKIKKPVFKRVQTIVKTVPEREVFDMPRHRGDTDGITSRDIVNMGVLEQDAHKPDTADSKNNIIWSKIHNVYRALDADEDVTYSSIFQPSSHSSSGDGGFFSADIDYVSQQPSSEGESGLPSPPVVNGRLHVENSPYIYIPNRFLSQTTESSPRTSDHSSSCIDLSTESKVEYIDIVHSPINVSHESPSGNNDCTPVSDYADVSTIINSNLPTVSNKDSTLLPPKVLVTASDGYQPSSIAASCMLNHEAGDLSNLPGPTDYQRVQTMAVASSWFL